MRRDDTDTERERLAQNEALRGMRALQTSRAHRACSASSSQEEMAKRREHRKKAEIDQASGAATASGETSPEYVHKSIALLYGQEAAEVMKTMPRRLPDLVLTGPHEAAPQFHEDWTKVDGSDRDPDKWEMELALRESRNRLIKDNLIKGKSVFYKSSGNSMWPWSSRTTPALSTPSRL